MTSDFLSSLRVKLAMEGAGLLRKGAFWMEEEMRVMEEGEKHMNKVLEFPLQGLGC